MTGQNRRALQTNLILQASASICSVCSGSSASRSSLLYPIPFLYTPDFRIMAPKSSSVPRRDSEGARGSQPDHREHRSPSSDDEQPGEFEAALQAMVAANPSFARPLRPGYGRDTGGSSNSLMTDHGSVIPGAHPVLACRCSAGYHRSFGWVVHRAHDCGPTVASSSNERRHINYDPAMGGTSSASSSKGDQNDVEEEEEHDHDEKQPQPNAR
jgi:hypothetical protein